MKALLLSAAAMFMPPNKLHLKDNIEEISNITESEFNTIIDKAECFYKPLMKARHGATLNVQRKWGDPTVNAYAVQYGKIWEVHMFGGLARRSEVTKDGFALVICHELGHHLAGFPFSGPWAANEGQSDYFSTLSCARELWAEEREKNAAASRLAPPIVKELCDEQWSYKEDQELCHRVMLAGKSLADLLSRGTAKYETPDRTQVSETNPRHPLGQCRLDTYMAGALCDAEFDKDTIARSEKDASKGVCLQSRNEAGFRPRCWFKPTL